MKRLYPYALVYEADSFENAPFAGDFTEGDTMKPAARKTEFAAITNSGRLLVRIRCLDCDPEKKEELRLRFDPDHSGRRPHNLVQVTLRSDGFVMAEKMEYDLIRLTPVDGVKVESSSFNGNVWEAVVSLPLPLVRREESAGRRYIGLNVIRTRAGERSYSKWSGLPGELYLHCLHGIGDLIFVNGLTKPEIDELVKKAIADSNTAYTRWEKQKLPPEIRKDVRRKKHGFTLRLKREDAERARANARQTDWGAEIARRILETADYWANKSDDELFDFILPGNPRAMTPSQFYGDPLTGGNRNTLKTCLETPYRFYNEETGEWWYPGKRVKNPSTGEEVVVEDNGEGFLIPEGFPNPGTRLMLVAAYRHYRLGMAMAGPYGPTITDKTVVPETTGTRYAGAIPNLAAAYVLTGDVRYAYKAAILIGRIAELYPYMNGGYHDGSYSDTVHLSEPSTTGTEWKKNLFEAYDLIFDAIDSFEDELISFFGTKPDAENKPRREPFDLRKTVEEEMIPYVIYACELERSGASDWSMRLLELEMEIAALIQNGELLHRVLLDSKFSLFSKMKNGYYRDGKYAYDSSGYVEMMSVAMMRYPDWVYQFQDGQYFPEPLNLFEDPRFGVKEAIAFFYRFRCGSLTSAFGDTGADNRLPISAQRKEGLIAYQPLSETVFRRMPSARAFIGPALAQYGPEELNRKRVESADHGRGIFHTLLLLANALSEDDLAPYRRDSGNVQPPFLLQDSEVSVLRYGTNARNTKHLILYGQPTLPHAHGDKLGLWLGAYGIHMLAFGGHYPFIWVGPKISQWELHSASCNVVLIDGRNQSPSSSIQLEHYEGSFIQVAGMENREAYPGSHYERWVWLVQAPDGENAYVLDQFHVSNGKLFDYNTHGLDVKPEQVSFEGADEWIPLTGTLAGEDVPLYSKPGYGWMKAIRKARVKGCVSWTYPYGDCGLKITALSEKERELYCCIGEKGGQEMKKAEWDTYVLWRDESENSIEHSATFVTVMEPFENRPFIESIQQMERIGGEDAEPFEPAGVCVSHPGGIRDLLIAARGKPVRFRDCAGAVHTTDAEALFIRYKGDAIENLEAIGYTFIESGEFAAKADNAAWEGIVIEADAENRRIRVRFSGERPDAGQIRDRVGLISSPDYKKPSPYYIREPQIEGDTLTFHTDISLYRGEADWKGSEKSRVQDGKSAVEYMDKNMLIDVKPGDAFRIVNRIVK